MAGSADVWKSLRSQGSPFGLGSAFSALTADIITRRLYREHFDYLGILDFKFAVREAFLGVSLNYHLARAIPGLITLLKSLPYPMIRLVLPGVADLLETQEEIKQKILISLDDEVESPKSFASDAKSVIVENRNDAAESESVIVGALGDPNIPPKERTLDRLLDEGTVVIFAGTETSSKALAVAMFYLLHNKSHLQKLREELATLPYTADNAYVLSQLEPLPFLVSLTNRSGDNESVSTCSLLPQTRVVNECLRLSFGVTSRLPRIATHEALQYKDHVIPPGVSLKSPFPHLM